jgi:hypothetical protein
MASVTVTFEGFTFTGSCHFSGPHHESDGAEVEDYDCSDKFYKNNQSDIDELIENEAYREFGDNLEESEFYEEGGRRDGRPWYARTSEGWATYRAETGYRE